MPRHGKLTLAIAALVILIVTLALQDFGLLSTLEPVGASALALLTWLLISTLGILALIGTFELLGITALASHPIGWVIGLFRIPEIGLIRLDSALRKGTDTNYEEFLGRRGPYWLDFESGYIQRTELVGEIISSYNPNNVSHLVIGPSGSGKTILVNSIGYEMMTKGNYLVYKKDLKEDELKAAELITGLSKIRRKKTLVIIDNVQHKDEYRKECNLLLKHVAKTGKSKQMLKNIRFLISGHDLIESKYDQQTVESELEILAKGSTTSTRTNPHDIVDTILNGYEKQRAFSFGSEDRVNLKSRYGHDLWILSVALQVYRPTEGFPSEDKIYDYLKKRLDSLKERHSIMDADNIFLTLSLFYSHEIDLEIEILTGEFRLNENDIRKLKEMAEIREKDSMFSLSHSSHAKLYLNTFRQYSGLGARVKRAMVHAHGDWYLGLCHTYLRAKPKHSIKLLYNLSMQKESGSGDDLVDSARALLRNQETMESAASRVSEATPAEFRKASYLLRHHKQLIEELDLYKIAETARSMKVDDLSEFANLLGALEEESVELIGLLDLEKIAETASSLKIDELGQLTNLLNAIDGRRKELIGHLNMSKLASIARRVRQEDINKVANLLDALHESRGVLVNYLDLKELGNEFNTAHVMNVGTLAHFLDALGYRREELVRLLDMPKLGVLVRDTSVEGIGQLANLLTALDNRRGQLTNHLDFAKLASECNRTSSLKEARSVLNLLSALQDEKSRIIKHLDIRKVAKAIDDASDDDFRFSDLRRLWDYVGPGNEDYLGHYDLERLVKRANQAKGYESVDLTHLISRLDKKSPERRKLIREIDWLSIIKNTQIQYTTFKAVALSLRNLCQQDHPSKTHIIQEVAKHLDKNFGIICEEIKKAYHPRYGKYYNSVAMLLYECYRVNQELASKILSGTMDELVENFEILPENYGGIALLFLNIHLINPELSEGLVADTWVKERIIRSINNEQSWKGQEEQLGYLVKSFYRANRNLWNTIIKNRSISADLTSLDLDSIYRDVETNKPKVQVC